MRGTGRPGIRNPGPISPNNAGTSPRLSFGLRLRHGCGGGREISFPLTLAVLGVAGFFMVVVFLGRDERRLYKMFGGDCKLGWV